MPIGVDFIGSTLRAGVVDGSRVLRSMTADAVPNAQPAELLDTIARVVFALEAQPDAVGVAIPGEVNTEGLCWKLPNTPGFEGLNIAKELSFRMGCPIAVENRATTAALAEWRYGHGREHASFMMITFGTGIGGGLVIGGQLFPGSNGFGAEVGHICVDTREDAAVCGCGQRGCLEAFAGTRAVLRMFSEFGGRATDIAQVSQSAYRRESAGAKTLESMGRAVGRALASVQNLLDLGAIVFSGGVSASFELIEPFIRAELRDHAFAPPLADVPLLVSELGENVGVIGAAHLTNL
jgi:glucokinase